MKKLTPEVLFECGAFQVSPLDKPFLYTSGLIGPFYVNTHFLCGGKESSEAELAYLDKMSGVPAKIVSEFPGRLHAIIRSSSIYSNVLGEMVSVLRSKNLDLSSYIISGGQRRDWFFSIPIAKELGLQHIYLFNDGLVLDENGEEPKGLEGKKTIHLADLLTLGSSYTTKWIPALAKYGVGIELAYNCVDRLQGGEENLTSAGVKEVLSFFKIDKSFFSEALELGIINEGQHKLIYSFLADNKGSMREFLLSKPEFISNVLSGSDEKAKKRVGLMLEQNLYDLPKEILGL